MPTANRTPGEFKPGDLVYFYADPKHEDYCVEVVEQTALRGYTRVQAWGLQTTGWYAGGDAVTADFRLLKRPKAGRRFVSPLPAPPNRGAAGAMLDPELPRQLAEAVMTQTAGWRAWYAGGRISLPTAVNTITTSVSVCSAIRLFTGAATDVGAAHFDNWRDTDWSEGGGYNVPNNFTVEQLEEYFWKALTLVLNHMDKSVTRCMACARAGRTSITHRNGHPVPRGSGGCEHFRCISCGLQQDVECVSCSTLHRTAAGYPADAVRYVCGNCCTHVECSCGCGATALRNHVCAAGHGPDCCDCPRCERPGCSRTQRDCCGRCASHCVCGDRCFPLQTHPLQKFPAPEGEKGLTRLIGTELETARAAKFGPKLRAAQKKWKFSVVSDGSIDAGGAEVVTQPAGGSQWAAMVKDLGEGFYEAETETSKLCGQHVHVDAGDLTVWDIRRLIKLYAAVEWALFDALPSERAQSRYCRPCGPEYTQWLAEFGTKPLKKMDLARKQYGLRTVPYGPSMAFKTKSAATRAMKEDLDNRRAHKYDETRYKALNLHSYWLRGTVEFRHAHGTNNPEQIYHWGLLCASIVEYAVKASDAELTALIDGAKVGADTSFVVARRVLLGVLSRFKLQTTREWLLGRWAKFTKSPGIAKAYHRDENGEV